MTLVSHVIILRACDSHVIILRSCDSHVIQQQLCDNHNVMSNFLQIMKLCCTYWKIIIMIWTNSDLSSNRNQLNFTSYINFV